jgi:hypothetical protein
MWRCGLSPAIRQRLKRRPSLGYGIEDIEEVAGATGQPIQARHNNPIAFPKHLDQLRQLRPIRPRPADFLRIDLGTSSRR